MKWFPEYKPVKSPVEDKKGWKFPYAGDDWPEKDDWYWIWACKPGSTPGIFTVPTRAWWDNAKQRFLAVTDEIYAWRKAVVVASR